MHVNLKAHPRQEQKGEQTFFDKERIRTTCQWVLSPDIFVYTVRAWNTHIKNESLNPVNEEGVKPWHIY